MPNQNALTLYFCGSGNKREQIGDYLVPALYDRTVGKQEDMWSAGARAAIFDGPGGSKNLLKFDAKEVFDLVGSGELVAARETGKKRSHAWTGSLTGAGVVSNLLHAWIWLRYKLIEEHLVAENINLVGFSRGAYSCLALAKLLQQDCYFELNQKKVNIFCFDPVPGGKGKMLGFVNDELRRFAWGGNFKKIFDVRKPEELPKIVNECHTIAQENIKYTEVQHKKIGKHNVPWGIIWKDANFQCVVPRREPGSAGEEPVIYPMPGHHSAAVNIKENAYEHTKTLGEHLCCEFLKRHGTEIDGFTPLDMKEINHCYLGIIRQFVNKNSKNGFARKPSGHRGRAVKNDHRDGNWFVNWHHASIASKPSAWHYNPDTVRDFDLADYEEA